MNFILYPKFGLERARPSVELAYLEDLSEYTACSLNPFKMA
ncbi:hypothetical protein VDG1235_26 [Verrucomicrobiia bacterium DG1235]|nr:hypothetical protein VDG1235_26 [Verrucomicrobiae bacterium DG1235]